MLLFFIFIFFNQVVLCLTPYQDHLSCLHKIQVSRGVTWNKVQNMSNMAWVNVYCALWSVCFSQTEASDQMNALIFHIFDPGFWCAWSKWCQVSQCGINFLRNHMNSYWVTARIIDHQREYIKKCTTHFIVESWAKWLIERLLGITHKQWFYHNARVHLEKLDDFKEEEHKSIMSRLQELISTDLEELLPQDWMLLEGDFESIGSGIAANRLYWITKMEVAIRASKHSTQNTRR